MGQDLHPVLKRPHNYKIVSIMYQGLLKTLDIFVFGPESVLLLTPYAMQFLVCSDSYWAI